MLVFASIPVVSWADRDSITTALANITDSDWNGVDVVRWPSEAVSVTVVSACLGVSRMRVDSGGTSAYRTFSILDVYFERRVRVRINGAESYIGGQSVC